MGLKGEDRELRGGSEKNLSMAKGDGKFKGEGKSEEKSRTGGEAQGEL